MATRNQCGIGATSAEPGWSRSSVVMLVLAGIGIAVSPCRAEERRVVVDRDGRMSEASAAARSGLTPEGFAQRFAATGTIECGGMRGVGQVTGRGDVVTSAAHVFFDEAGRSRAESGRCVFLPAAPNASGPIALFPDVRTCGSAAPYAAAGRHDWAVARLARPVAGIRPYRIGAAPRPGQEITVVGFEGGRRTVDFCRVRDARPGEAGAVELRTDCVGFDGLSGAAYLTQEAEPRIVGVHVGFRTRRPGQPGAFADDHHTFGTALVGGFARAVASAGRREVGYLEKQSQQTEIK